MHCKYLPVVPYKALENFSKALYGTTGGTYSACIIRPVMSTVQIYDFYVFTVVYRPLCEGKKFSEKK